MDLELNTITSGLKGNIGFDMKPMHGWSWITKVSAKEWVWGNWFGHYVHGGCGKTLITNGISQEQSTHEKIGFNIKIGEMSIKEKKERGKQLCWRSVGLIFN